MVRTAVWLVAVLLGVVVAALTAAWVFGDGDPTKGIAIFGTVVASVGAIKHIYDIWEKVEEKKKKADEAAEKVVAKPIVGCQMHTSPVVAVELHNDGKVAVPIKSVTLLAKSERGQYRLPMVTRGEMETQHTPDGRTMSNQQYPTRAKLEPADPAVVFFIQFMPKEMGLGQLLAMPPDDFCIRVESNKAVVVEVKGAEIQALIKGTPKPPKREITTG